MTLTTLSLLVGAILLDGVTGEDLVARAAFDANNVRVGDPMILTVDFIGTADFAALHPPALAKEVDAKTWKVDDYGAKTETYLNARRLVYRVRPMREGVLEFPALTFGYARASGGEATVSTRPVPVHAKAGTQAALAGLEEDDRGLPMPDGLIIDLASSPWGTLARVGDDELFRWRRACANPSSSAFEKFDFPEARLNEAAAALTEGAWAKALRIYSSVEWRVGQIPAVERGIVAALARKNDDPAAELPVWRQSLRPVLRFAWPGRLLVVVSVLVVAALLVWLCSRAVRAIACLAVVLLASQAGAQVFGPDPFERMDRLMQEALGDVNQMMNAMGGGMNVTINGQPRRPVEVKASLRTSKTDIRVGETFEYVVALETPRTHTLGQVQLVPSEMFGMVVVGKVQTLTDGRSANPSNVVRRLSVPVRYDVPFTGDVSFTVTGMVSGKEESGGGRGRMSFTFSQNFRAESAPVRVEVKPLPSDNQPADFSGAIGNAFGIRCSVDRNRVETNDVVKVVTTLEYIGYVPQGALPGEAERRAGTPARVVAENYFVASGAEAVPDVTFVYYDTERKNYSRLVAKGPRLVYVAPEEETADTVAVNGTEGGSPAETRVLKLRFVPQEAGAVVCSVPHAELGAPGAVKITETAPGGWVRVDTGRHAGWVRKGELE